MSSTCDTCKYARKQAMPQQGRVQLICYYAPPFVVPLISYVQNEGGLMPQPIGGFNARPEVQPMDWCGHHTPAIVVPASVTPIRG